MVPETRQFAVTIYNTLDHCDRLDCIEASDPKDAATKALREACLLEPQAFSLNKPPKDTDGIFKIGIIKSNQLWVELIDKSLGACSSYLATHRRRGYKIGLPQRDTYLWKYPIGLPSWHP